MGFDQTRRLGLSLSTIHKLQCRACPLDKIKENKNPHMPPSGTDRPLIYCLGEGPGASEDEEGFQFVGRSGQELRSHIPRDLIPKIRWNNVVRTRPVDNATPTELEIECCFPADTLVSSIGAIKTLYRRWYDGPMVTVKTASRRILTGTPNHPIFTIQGQVALKNIKIGDYAFSTPNSYPSFPRSPNRYNKPTSIGEIFSTALKPRQMKRMRSSALDFHGDGMPNSNIDIIRTNSQLACGFNIRTQLQQHASESNLTFTYTGSSLLMYPGSFDADLSIFAVIASSNSFFSGMLFHPESHLFRNTSDLDSVFFENGDNTIFPYPQRAPNFTGAFSPVISRNYGFSGQSSPSSFTPSFELGFSTIIPELYSRFDQELPDSFFSRSGEFFKLTDTFPASIEFDKIISVETISNFRGHVFNLETESHKYIAEGLVVSNCRPSIVQDIELTKPKIILGFGGIPLSWVAPTQSGMGKWRGRRMPVKIGTHKCWFYSMYHPAYIVRMKHPEPELERVFDLDLQRAFRDLENLPEPEPYDISKVNDGIEITDDIKRIRSFLKEVSNEESVGFDYETTGLRPYNKGMKIISLAVSTGDKTLAFPIEHRDRLWTKQEYHDLLEAVYGFLEAPVHKIAHNLSFELEWTGVILGRDFLYSDSFEDTQVQASIIDERAEGKGRGCQSLEFLIQQYFGFSIKSLANLDKEHMAEEPLDDILIYNGGDAKFTKLLFDKQAEILREEGLEEVYRRAVARVPTAVLTQIKGVPVNQIAVNQLHMKYVGRIEVLKAEIAADDIAVRTSKILGKPFNPGSPDHVLTAIKKVMGNQDAESADADALKAMNSPFTDSIIELRQAVKIESTYVKPLASSIYEDGLIHHNLNTTFVETGRSSADNPNLQNQPIRDEEGREVRKPIEAPPGYLIAAFDYKQIQTCNIAMESKDENLVRSLCNKEDIHMEWAERFASLYSKRFKKHSREKSPIDAFRGDVKNQWTFPLFFGCSAGAASSYLEIPSKIIEPEYDRFWDKYPNIRRWQQLLVSMYQENGYVAGLTGRRRHAPLSKNMVINSPIQSDEAELMFDAFTRISRLQDWDYQPIMEIHDDLTFLLPKKRLDSCIESIVDEMLYFDFDWINVPMGVELKVGPNWLELEKIDTFYSDTWDK